MPGRTILWWGRSDPEYSRNRIIWQLLGDLGWHILDFRPYLSAVGDIEASLRRLPTPDLVWVPCFRQRDAAAAARWAERRGVAMVFDPLISAWDKQVFEREKFGENDRRAARLRDEERTLFAAADLVLADTEPHREFFVHTFGLDPGRVAVVPVGAEESLFRRLAPQTPRNNAVQILFYGSFIALQAPQVIIEAARLYEGPPVRWHLLGEGPLLETCRERARQAPNVIFEPWLAYDMLPARIGDAQIVLGVFGASEKAGRVIPNKVFQALACGRPVITRTGPAYPQALDQSDGIALVPPNRPDALAQVAANWASDPERLAARAEAAAAIYRKYFASETIRASLRDALSRLDEIGQAGTRSTPIPKPH
ncbi:MAG: glycosyltransferase [Rhodospirillales bacterium]|nr:MAG: glycosyltransferase [Rhodospirillales bacterium]